MWYDPSTRHIHVTIPGADAQGAHWSYAMYRELLKADGRWPADAE